MGDALCSLFVQIIKFLRELMSMNPLSVEQSAEF